MTKKVRMKAKLSFHGLTKGLDKRTYAISKVNAWMNMLNQNMRPVRFYNPTINGTNVSVEQILDQSDYDKGLEELEAYTLWVNEKYGTDFRLRNETEVVSK